MIAITDSPLSPIARPAKVSFCIHDAELRGFAPHRHPLLRPGRRPGAEIGAGRAQSQNESRIKRRLRYSVVVDQALALEPAQESANAAPRPRRFPPPDGLRHRRSAGAVFRRLPQALQGR